MKLYCGQFRRGQFICREICCFVHLARKNILQPKKKMAETIFMAQPSLFFPYFDFALMNVMIYRDEVKLLLIQVYFFYNSNF